MIGCIKLRHTNQVSIKKYQFLCDYRTYNNIKLMGNGKLAKL